MSHYTTLVSSSQCEGLVEEYEDYLIQLFSSPRKGITKELCFENTNICQYINVHRDEL